MRPESINGTDLGAGGPMCIGFQAGGSLAGKLSIDAWETRSDWGSSTGSRAAARVIGAAPRCGVSGGGVSGVEWVMRSY